MAPGISLESLVASDVDIREPQAGKVAPIEEPFELETAEDFAKIADEDGRILVLGFGSLMSGEAQFFLIRCYHFVYIFRITVLTPHKMWSSQPG